MAHCWHFTALNWNPHRRAGGPAYHLRHVQVRGPRHVHPRRARGGKTWGEVGKSGDVHWRTPNAPPGDNRLHPTLGDAAMTVPAARPPVRCLVLPRLGGRSTRKARIPGRRGLRHGGRL